MTTTKTNRYSEADLQEFKTLLEVQLEKAIIGHNRMQSQLDDITEIDDESDMVDESIRGNELEMLYMMLGRSRKHLQDLENALLRIRNKSYGICIVTGELIDKRRLLAVLTTTKSLLGKQNQVVPFRKIVRINSLSSASKIISKVILKPATKLVAKTTDELNDFDDFLGETESDFINADYDSV